MPMLKTVNDEIREIIAKFANKNMDEIQSDSDFISLGLDSLSWLDVLAEVEIKFDIHIPDDDLIMIRKLDELEKNVEKLLQAKSIKVL